jgi:hypothetical protein
MYREVEGSPRMDQNEASELYPDSYIVMRMDDMVSQVGQILYVGDTEKEMSTLVMQMDDPSYCGVIEGLNHQRKWGRVVVCG